MTIVRSTRLRNLFVIILGPLIIIILPLIPINIISPANNEELIT